jgi:hypothetical protein
MAAFRIFAIVLVVTTLLSAFAHAQGLGQKGGGRSEYPVEDHPKVEEKAYKAALGRIPEPDRKYDPWSVVRPSEPARGASEQMHSPEAIAASNNFFSRKRN